MAIDNVVEQLLERIRQDPEIRRQLAQLVFGPELVQFAEQIGQLTTLLGRLAETVQDGFRVIGERFALVDTRLAELSRIVEELAAQQRETTNLLHALTERMNRVEQQQAATTEQIRLLTERMERVEQQQAATTAQIQALTQRVAELTERMDRVERQQAATTEQIRLLTERMDRVERQQAETTAQIQALTQRVAELTERMERVERQIAELTLFVQRHTDNLAQLRGWYLGVRMRDRAPAIFGIWMDATRVVPPMEVRKLVRDTFSRSQLQRLLSADIIVSGVLDEHPATPTIWLVIEVSATVDETDVERALARAELLRRVVPDVIPVVAGDQLTDPARLIAEEERVVIVRDGTISGWEEAIERWVRAA